ncbi:hypothetical protein PFISCL1PPCAC_16900, partial [Pristionchus fissidentatus]
VEQPDIICITESWLNSRTPSSLLIGNLPYTLVRRDRTRSRGGGTLLIIRDHFHFSVVQSVNDDIECLSVDLLTSSSLFIRLCIVYRPPSYSNPQTESLTDSLSDLIATSPYPVVFIGDFNSDNITSPISPIDKTLDSFVSSSGLSHLIRSPTRSNRCIDWLLTSDISCISDPTVIPAFPSSVRDYARVHYEDLTTYLHSFDWYDLFCSSPNSNDMYNVFTSVVHNGIDKFVPYHCPKPKIASYPHIQNLINHRNILFAKINIPSVRSQYEQCSRDLLSKIKKWNQFCEKKKIKRTKDLYRHIRSLTKTKSIVPKELISSSGCAVTGISNITNLLATQFASYFTLDDGCIPTIPSLPLPPFLSMLRTASIDTRISKAQTALFIMLRAVSINCPDILLK